MPYPASDRLHLTGILVLALDGDRIRELTHVETTLAPYSGLPRSLDQVSR
jgi:hypothetical protein